MTAISSGYQVFDAEWRKRDNWLAQFGRPACEVISHYQGWGVVQFGTAIAGGALRPGGVACEFGLGTHADSLIELRAPGGIRRMRALAGVDRNPESLRREPALSARMHFRVLDEAGRVLAESPELNITTPPHAFDIALDGESRVLRLEVKADHIALAHADWGNLEVELADGKVIPVGVSGMGVRELPVDFRYDGMTAEEFFRRYGWRREEAGETLRFIAGGVEAKLEMILEMKRCADLPALEWSLRFRNPGTTASAPLSAVRSMAFHWTRTEGFRLHRAKGSFHRGTGAKSFRQSFFPVIQDLNVGDCVRSAGVEGRSSVDWMPYFNLETGDGAGCVFAVGWSGQWVSEVTANPGMVGVTAGLEDFDAWLEPGEELVFPSSLLLFYQGDAQRGHNLLRRYLARHVMPTTELPVSNLTWGGMPEQEHLDRIANIAKRQMPFDCYWIDAGWYGPEGTISPNEFDMAWGSNTGCWKFNPTILPRRLRPISEAAHQGGMAQLLWMEPERVNPGTPVAQEHPEWCLPGGSNDGPSLLLNLGDRQAWQWCFDTIAELIADNDLDWFRNDFNMSPLEYWRRADAPGRRGVSEVRYIAGLYRLWQELLRRFPHLKIDDCASGGRRLDFEQLRYSVPLWACDMECYPEMEADWQQHHVAGLAYWLPVFGFGTQNQAGGDTYNFHGVMAAGLAVHYFTYECTPISEEYPHDWLRTRLQEFHATKHYYCGDYYLLCDFSDTGHAWMQMQFDRPDLGEGLLKVFRGAASPYCSCVTKLRGLQPEQQYVVGDVNGAESVVMSGKDLMDHGLPVDMPEPRSSRLMIYRVKK